jgi:hypothetical protein
MVTAVYTAIELSIKTQLNSESQCYTLLPQSLEPKMSKVRVEDLSYIDNVALNIKHTDVVVTQNHGPTKANRNSIEENIRKYRGRKPLKNVGTQQQDCKMSQARRPQFECSLL